jgi:RNA polymerase sigma factor (sigma-70 family)
VIEPAAQSQSHTSQPWTLSGAGIESDEDLAARAARDADAFAELYRRYAEPIRRYCSLRLSDWWIVEDVTSEIFIQALERLHVTSVSSVRPWLFTIAHHRCTDRYRRPRNEVDLNQGLGELSAATGPEAAAVLNSEIERLRWAIASLKPDQAHVIELRLAGLDGPEIRQVLHRSRAWVDTTQYRALKRLRELLHANASSEEQQ